MKKIKVIIFFVILFVFIYLRLAPVINQTVPYTYDQGRDFMKAAEMIRNQRPTFIGPTTGIMGVFHGAWWFYLITIPYLLFRGLPIGFYIFMLLIATGANLLFAFFIKKRFDDISALVFLSIVASSPYFIPLAFSAGNNVVVPYLILLLIVMIFRIFDKKQSNIVYFLIGLSLTFIFEFEVAFGLFLLPVFTFTSLLFREVRFKLYKIKNIPYLMAGLAIPLIPRALFEIKNHFLQTKTLLGFFLNPKLHNPKPFLNVVSDRISLFANYGKGLFAGNYPIVLLVVILATLFILIFYSKKNRYIGATRFITILIALLFAISLYYKDNFWVNYYEGIQYLFLILVIIAFHLLNKQKKFIAIPILLLFVFLNIATASSDFINSSKIREPIGLKEAQTATLYVYQQRQGEYLCLRIYTPPVIPYTYHYLLDYYAGKYHIRYPKGDFVDNKCWFIIESDSYQFRVDGWRRNNIPEGSKLIKKNTISNNVTIEEWQLKAD